VILENKNAEVEFVVARFSRPSPNPSKHAAVELADKQVIQ